MLISQPTGSVATQEQRKVQNAWCIYDWANSAYNLVITSTIFPIYYGAVAVSAERGEIVRFLGYDVHNSVLFSYAVSFSFLIVALLIPFLTAISDYSGRKKAFMRFFCYLGAICCLLLFFFDHHTRVIWGISFFVLASVGYSGSIVFYNAYIPEIALEEEYDRLSARGFSLGYIGSVLLLVAVLLMYNFPHLVGDLTDGQISRLAFVLTGIWWFIFAQYTFKYLPADTKPIVAAQKDWLFNGFKKLKQVVKELRSQKILKRYLFAFFFFNMGVQTVMYLAAIFGDKELKLPADSLILTILILQLIAIPGAYGFAWLSEKIGNIASLMVAVVLWIGICVGAYYTYTAMEFYILAACVGLVMGGIQSLSRATYSKLMPEDTEDNASYFSFYDVVEKLSIVLGTLAYGLATQLTGNMRASVLVVGVFFILGGLLLLRIPSRKVYHLYK